MRRHRFRGVLAVAGLVLLTAAVAGCGGPGGGTSAGGPGYTETLQRFRGGNAFANKIVDLPGGDRFSVGSPDGHRLVAQRYDADSKAWSRAKTVYTEQQWTHVVSVEHRGGTVAIGADYWSERVLADDYAPDHSVGAVCVGLDCSRGYRFPGLSSPNVSDDGSYVTYGDGDGFVTWSGGELRRVRVTGVPTARFAAQMVGDGSFRGIAGIRAPGGCRWALSTSAPRSLHFTAQVTSTVHPTDDRTCDPALDNAGQERVAVFVEAIGGSVEFARGPAGSWREVPQPVKHQKVADTGGRSSIAPVFSRARGAGDQEAVIYSPDGHQIMAQYNSPYTSAWSKPETVLTTDPQTPCRSAAFTTDDHPDAIQDTLWATVRCWSGGRRAGLSRSRPSDETVVMVSFNGGTVWTALQVHDAGRIASSRAGLSLLVAGAPTMVATEEGKRFAVKLPMVDPAHDALSIDNDSRVTRMRTLPVGAGCVAQVQVAQVDDSAWGTAATSPLPGVRRTPAGRCPDAVLSWSDDDQVATVAKTRWVVSQDTGRLQRARR